MHIIVSVLHKAPQDVAKERERRNETNESL